LNPSIQIKIQGRDYVLRSQKSEEQIQRVVGFVEEKLAETASGKSVDTRDLTVLTLLNLAGQYLQLSAEQDQNKENQNERLQLLIDRLERAVTDNSGC
jgi:cell division protein ZapA